ncbi:protein arginine N-methyltransferase 2 isoform X2 [Alosa sapidissima]|uniref:protein arginine N-methyltransferase 2 isoform X2 n=1 Tax=Alosa sapidissima TaxID=34773 RepID=UPI001C09883F|nr:protein arginine N-methyltransferase 2 isoform X2 [Alosa sapidissima]
MFEVERDCNHDNDVATEEFVGMANFSANGNNQLSFSLGDRLLVHEKNSSDWWWAELGGRFGYVPSSYLQLQESDQDDSWQDEEYFESYGTLVYAVEASTMAEYTERLVKANGCEGLVTVLRGRVEELSLPEKVDVLVSEWMGNCLLFEFMVESVLHARDRWLKEGGIMWPSLASITMVPCEAFNDFSEKVEFWEKPYGLDFSCLQPVAKKEFFSKPKFSHQIRPEDCLCTPSDVITLDMHTLQVGDLEKLKGEFCFKVEKTGVFHGFTAWFSVGFHGLERDGPTMILDTGPHSEPTHWKQTLFMLDTPTTVHTGDCISGAVVFQRNPIWRRHLTITFQWSINGNSTGHSQLKTFPMWR